MVQKEGDLQKEKKANPCLRKWVKRKVKNKLYNYESCQAR